MTIDEEGLKSRILSKFRKERIITSSSTIASEFVLGKTGRRCDLAIWNGEFIGIEVKSARDTLMRLQDQIRAYRCFFDKVIVLCDEAHLLKVERLCRNDVGIYVWTGKHEIDVYRSPTKNLMLDRHACIKSLTLKQLEAASGKRPLVLPRAELERQIMCDVAIDARRLVTDAFEITYNSTSDAFWKAVARKRITERHLATLSRFAAVRAEEQLAQEARKTFWLDWTKQAQAVFS